MELIYVKGTKWANELQIMLAVRMIQIVRGYRWLIRVRNTLHGFSRSDCASDFRTIYRVPSRTESKVYLQLPLIQLINRGITAMVERREHMDYNDDTPSDNGGGYLPFNYFAITGSRVLVS